MQQWPRISSFFFIPPPHNTRKSTFRHIYDDSDVVRTWSKEDLFFTMVRDDFLHERVP